VKKRRSLQAVGGPTQTRGESGAAEACARAFAAKGDERLDVHGFHTYPARMHPAVARAIVEIWSKPGEVVLDPFCGSGTVLVEAMAAGRRAMGMDLNPLAVKLASFKARPWAAARAQAIPERARAVAERAARARHGAPKGEGAWFAPHVLVELGNLRGEILREPEGQAREGLELVMSSILVKLSRQESDTRRAKVDKQIARGFPTRLFVRKAEELAAQLSMLGTRLAAGAEAARVTGLERRRCRWWQRRRRIAASWIIWRTTNGAHAGWDWICRAWRAMKSAHAAIRAISARTCARRWPQPHAACVRAAARSSSPPTKASRN
jgi:DNA methylase